MPCAMVMLCSCHACQRSSHLPHHAGRTAGPGACTPRLRRTSLLESPNHQQYLGHCQCCPLRQGGFWVGPLVYRRCSTAQHSTQPTLTETCAHSVQCYCYVCDVPVSSCTMWNSGTQGLNCVHVHPQDLCSRSTSCKPQLINSMSICSLMRVACTHPCICGLHLCP